ncbi:hypothetical protein C8R47DRAFT_1218273 [Mycena vitilis]|nr:hypothetical protein C8R47DRAFT_1218273 [Mycena vitilis]
MKAPPFSYKLVKGLPKRFTHAHMQLPTSPFIALALTMIFCSAAAGAPPLDAECSAELDYCGVWHDGVFHQYRACCGDLACTSYDHITRAVTDIRCK